MIPCGKCGEDMTSIICENRCDVCKKHVPTVYTGAQYEYSNKQEPRQTTPSLNWCKECYSDEWDSRTFMYPSRTSAEQAWEKKRKQVTE